MKIKNFVPKYYRVLVIDGDSGYIDKTNLIDLKNFYGNCELIAAQDFSKEEITVVVLKENK